MRLIMMQTMYELDDEPTWVGAEVREAERLGDQALQRSMGAEEVRSA